MLIKKTDYYTIYQSYASRTENEFEIYDNEENRIGYIVENKDNTCEIYHNANDDYSDYNSIDYTDNFDDAVDIIVNEIAVF